MQNEEISFTPIIIFIALVAIPVVAGHDTFGLGVVGWTITSAIVGAVAFLINRPNTPLLSMLCGAIIGIGTQLTAYYYFKDRDSFFRIEVVVPFVVGALPGVLIYNIGLGLADFFSFLKKGPR
ncbi:MAG: hypothetical protein ACKVUS_02710 [Saprospiraceae bacterium]